MPIQGTPGTAKLVCFDFDDTLVKGHFHGTLFSNSDPNNHVVPKTYEQGVQILQANNSFLRLTGGPQGGFSPQTTAQQGQGASPQKIQELIQQFGLKNPQEYAKAMIEAINNGHKVAITSFTLYPEVVVPTLQAMFKTVNPPLTQQQINGYIQQICVVGGYPSNGATQSSDPGFYGKEEHIQAAMRFFERQGIKIDRSNAILVDDSKPNTEMAKQWGGPLVVEVPKVHNASAAYINQIHQHTAVNANRLQQAPQVQNASPQDLKEAQSFLEKGDYRNVGPLKDLKFKRGIVNYTFDITQENGRYFANINPEYRDEAQQKVAISLNDIQNMAKMERALVARQVAPITPPPSTNATVVASRPIVTNNPAITKPTTPPPNPPAGAQAYAGQMPRQPTPPIVKPTDPLPMPSVVKPTGPLPIPPQRAAPPPQAQNTAPVVPTFLPPPPFVGLYKPPSQGPRIPAPLKETQVAQMLQNPKLDAILSPTLQGLMQAYQSNKENIHRNDHGLTSLFNKAKSAVNSVKGTADERTNQLASIVNMFADLKKQQTMDPAEKATLAYAHLENIKKESNSSGMRTVCLQLQTQIKSEFPNVVEKGVKAEFRDKAKALLNDAHASKNDNKMR